MDFFQIVRDFIVAELVDDLAFLNDVVAVGEFAHEVEILFHEQDREPRFLEAPDSMADLVNDDWGQPFGGFKQSGIGREQAEATLDHYSQTKTINMNL